MPMLNPGRAACKTVCVFEAAQPQQWTWTNPQSISLWFQLQFVCRKQGFAGSFWVMNCEASWAHCQDHTGPINQWPDARIWIASEKNQRTMIRIWGVQMAASDPVLGPFRQDGSQTSSP